jgi:uncharacterized protein (TIGR02145 family)
MYPIIERREDMKKSLILMLSIAVSLCFSQINISGIVTNSGGTALEGAVVKLEQLGLSDTTGSDGTFELTDTTTGIMGQTTQSTHKMSVNVNGGALFITATEKSPVEITTYNLQGKNLFTLNKSMEVGTHAITLPDLGKGVHLYKVKSGSSEFVLKSCSMAGGAITSLKGAPFTSTAKESRNNALIDDVIKATKSGYLNYRVIVTNSDTSGIEIKMIESAGTVTDIDSNVYQTVQIGNQVWTVENWRSTKYNDGSAIPHVPDTAAWAALSTPGYCYYNNATHADTIKKWGALYNWYVVAPTNPKHIAPAGWHVPTDAEWDTLQNYLIANGYNWDGTTAGNKIAKSMAARTDWADTTIPGTTGSDLSINNASGFSALPGSNRNPHGHFYYQQSVSGYWWSTTEDDASIAWLRNLYYDLEYLFRRDGVKEFGFSVRLLRDN